MFAIGKVKTKVINGKVSLPAEYHLKNTDMYGSWYGKEALFLSDTEAVLKNGRGEAVFQTHVDSEHRIRLEDSYEDMDVEITGCVSTIQLLFKRR